MGPSGAGSRCRPKRARLGMARAALTAGFPPQVPLAAPCCSEASSGRALMAAAGRRRRPTPLLLFSPVAEPPLAAA